VPFTETSQNLSRNLKHINGVDFNTNVTLTLQPGAIRVDSAEGAHDWMADLICYPSTLAGIMI
jgi:hypothetical protein